MSFHNVRLREEIEQGAQGGPRFKTTVLTLDSGHEKRNIEWSRSRGSWDIAYGVDNKDTLEEVIDFFYARHGRAYGFRFKDWTDFEAGEVSTPEPIGTGDGTTRKFQLVKTYWSGAHAYVRPITRPVSGTVRVFLNNVEQASHLYVMDHDTGVLNMDTAPAAGVSVGAVFQFDVPVRFDQDELNLNAIHCDVFSIPAIRIIEIREDLQSI